MIHPFPADGYLPDGLYRATEAEITFRFGAASTRRRWLALRLRRWIELARQVAARRLMVDGSFVTDKLEPNDVDVVIFLPADFEHQIHLVHESAMELDQMMLSRRPEEIFAAADESDWYDWVEFFSRTREADGRRKGLVEVEL